MLYTLIKETLHDDTLGNYESFGIENENGYKISDISTNMEDVERLLSKINENQTPEIYLHYEIDRLLSEI
ncbi:MAG: hypothetical protein Q4D57_05695 [Clostridia bacterium]|nr:hypothetical protein [Clostridia bacterium]